jgi:type I restriction enzyme M protein
MFVQSERFVNIHQGVSNLSIYGQESNPTTWRLAAMNLAIRGIEFDLGKEPADTFHNDQHPHLRADYILANPPFNVSDWGGEKLTKDARWRYGIPPAGNANFAWVQHMLSHLAPTGIMGTVLANGSMSSQTGGEGEIRKNLIEADLVECMVALPGQLFFNTQIPVCLWFLRKQKKRTGEVLVIDARNLGFMADRTRREFTDGDIAQIADTYHAWRADDFAPKDKDYADIKGFCKSAKLAEIRTNDYVLTPGRYVGVAETQEDDEAFSAKMARLTAELTAQMEESAKLDTKIKENLEKIEQ